MNKTLIITLLLSSCYGRSKSKATLSELKPPVVIVAFMIPTACSEHKSILVADGDSILHRIDNGFGKAIAQTIYIGDTIKRVKSMKPQVQRTKIK